MDTTTHHGHYRHQGTIHQTQTTPQGSMDTMGTADTRHYRCYQAPRTPWALQTPGNSYITHYGHHQEPRTPWAHHTPGNNTPDTMETARHHGHCRHHGTIYQKLRKPQGSMDTMGTADKREPYTRHYGHQLVRWTPWALQTTGKYTPYTKDTTRYGGNHGHSRYQGTKHTTLWTPPGTMGTAPSALKTPDTIDATKDDGHHGHYRHLEIIHHTLWTPPGTMDTMGFAYTMEPYTRHYGPHNASWTPWALKTPRNDTKDTMVTTRHHGHCRHLGTIQQTQTTRQATPWTPWAMQTLGNHRLDTMDTTRNHGHQGIIHLSLWTLPGTNGHCRHL